MFFLRFYLFVRWLQMSPPSIINLGPPPKIWRKEQRLTAFWRFDVLVIPFGSSRPNPFPLESYSLSRSMRSSSREIQLFPWLPLFSSRFLASSTRWRSYHRKEANSKTSNNLPVSLKGSFAFSTCFSLRSKPFPSCLCSRGRSGEEKILNFLKSSPLSRRSMIGWCWK